MPLDLRDAPDRRAKDDWVTFMLGRDPRQQQATPPVDPRVEAARAAIPALANQFARLVLSLKLARGGDALIGEATALQSKIGAVGDNDGDAAEATLTQYRDCLARATALCDGELARRREFVVPLDTRYADKKLAAAQAALAPSLPLLADAATWQERLSNGVKAVQAACHDPRLGLMGSDADTFDAGALAATEACGKWDTAKAEAEAAIAAEQKARREAVPALAGRALATRNALTTEVTTANRLAPKTEKEAEKFYAALGSAVPGWETQAALLARLANVPPDGAEALPHAAYTKAIQDGGADCASAEDLTPKVKTWTTEFEDVRPLGRKAAEKAKAFTEKFQEAKRSCTAAMQRVATAIGEGNFATAKREIATLTATLDAAETAGGKLPEALKTWKQLAPALIKSLPVQTGALTKLGDTLKQKPGELAADPAALGNAQNFLAGVNGIGALRDATATVNAPMSDFRDRSSPYADVLARQRQAILNKALPATDPGFATATAEMGALGREAAEAFKARDTNVKARTQLRNDISKDLGKDTKFTLALQAQVDDVNVDTGAKAKLELERIRALAGTLKASSKALDYAVKEGSNALGASNLGLSTLVGLRQKAEAAIAAQIETGGGAVPPEIEALKSAYKYLVEFNGRDRDADGAITAAEKVPTPSELVDDLRAEHTKARQLAGKLSQDAADASLEQAERLAALLTTTTATFARIDAAIAHGASDAAKAMQTKREEAIKAARAWTGAGGAFSAELSRIVGDLPGALRDAYAHQRAKRDPDEVIKQHKAIVATFAALPDKPPPPADPAALIATIGKQASNDAPGGIKRLIAEFDPLLGSIATIFPLLTAIAGYAADWAALTVDYGTAVADAHPKPKKELEKLKNAADEKRLTDPVKGRSELAALRVRVDAIRNMNAGWKGPVPNPAPQRGGPFATAKEAMDTATVLLKDGGLTLAAIESLVPAGTANTFGPSGNYPTGFKYEWTTTNGKTIEVYGHGASHGANVDPTSVSAQGNIVRIKIDGQFLQSNATKKYASLTDEGHIPLFGNP